MLSPFPHSPWSWPPLCGWASPGHNPFPSFLWTCCGTLVGCSWSCPPVWALQALLMQGCSQPSWQCCGLALGSCHEAGGKGTTSSGQPQFLLCGFTSRCEHAQEPSEVWGMQGAPPHLLGNFLKPDVHHFFVGCQHPITRLPTACRRSRLSKAPVGTDRGCRRMPCSWCMGWEWGLPKDWPQQPLAILEDRLP